MTVEEKAMWFDRGIRFAIDKDIHLVMKSKKNGEGNWAIVDVKKNLVLNSNLEWEEEPALEKRDDGFKIRTRFTFENAIAMFEQYKMFAM